jgi:excinuclease ABC subunit C
MSQSSDSVFDIDAYLQQLPLRPGVYRMLDAGAEVLYVGKAVNLKNRVSSNTQ